MHKLLGNVSLKTFQEEEKCVTTDKFQNVYLDRRSLIYHSNTGKDETNLLRTQQPTKHSNRMINRMIRNGVIFELPNGGNSFLIRRLSNLQEISDHHFIGSVPVDR